MIIFMPAIHSFSLAQNKSTQYYRRKNFMKTKNIISLILAIALATAMFAGCSSNESSASTGSPSTTPSAEESPSASGALESAAGTITVTDDANHNATLTLPVERVALIDSGPGAALSALGKLDTVVGTHQALQNSLYSQIAADATMVATYAEINYEALAEAQPQLVLSATSHHGYISESDHLDEFGIQFIALDLRTPSRMRDDFRLLGRVFEREAEAQRVIDFYDKYENILNERLSGVPENERPTVFFEMHAGDYHTGSPESQFYQQVELAGGRNIAADLADNPLADDTEVSAEWVAERNPDFILREATSLGQAVASPDETVALVESIKARPGLEGVTAIRENQIIAMGIDVLSRPGYIVGVCYLAKQLYPELFADLDIGTVHQEWYDIAYNGAAVEGTWFYFAE
jgi:iron complex transport system substrate-binding protein